jgi:hypothetical protein
VPQFGHAIWPDLVVVTEADQAHLVAAVLLDESLRALGAFAQKGFGHGFLHQMDRVDLAVLVRFLAGPRQVVILAALPTACFLAVLRPRSAGVSFDPSGEHTSLWQ